MQYIENKYLKVGINDELGGSLTSIFDKNTNEECLYQPVPDSWSGQDVVIFPFIARLKGTYEVDGKEYSMKNHGLARYHSFKVIDKKEDSIELEFESDESTKKEYPYDFILTVKYALFEATLKIEYKVKNPSNLDLYFALGAHPAMKIDEDEHNEIKGNYLLFPKGTKVTQMILDPTFSYIEGEYPPMPLERLDVDRTLFKREGTLMLRVDNLKECTLVRKNGRMITYNFNNNDYLALWTNPNIGDYLCVEPWTSLPDYMDAPKEFKQKKTLHTLSGGSEFILSYSITL